MAVGKKICMLGDFGVGKTSLVRRFVHDEFSPEYQTTLGVNIYKYTDEVQSNGEVVEFRHLLWDIEGGLQRESLLDSYIGGSAGAIVVGDITRSDRLETMRENAQRFRQARPGRPVVFALNKTDLVEGDPEVDGAEDLAKDFRGVVIYSSAQSGEAVATLFRTLAEQILAIKS
jgi:small GTP-binding protein